MFLPPGFNDVRGQSCPIKGIHLKGHGVTLIDLSTKPEQPQVCDGKTLRESAMAAEDCSNRSVAHVSDYDRALGLALAQTTYESGESNERAALNEPLSTLDVEGVLIQADALHTTPPFFSCAWRRGPTCS
jgi:hypothetical protein